MTGTRDYSHMWTARAQKLLVGRTITAVSYLDAQDAGELDWYGRSLCIEFDNGLVLFASSDDEGNGPGALFTTDEALPTIPVLPL
jgi:hypothetical protein